MSASPGQTGERFKKWAITIAAVVALIGLGSTARLWVPWLLQVAHTKKDTIEEVKKLLELVALPVGWVFAAIIFIIKLWSEKKEQAQPPLGSTAQSEQAGRDLIHAGGNVQTGGMSVAPQRDLILQGGDIVQNKTEIHHASAPLLTSLHQFRPPRADFQGRKNELAELHAAMNAATTAGRAIISGLQGQGGIGKTELALKLAEELMPHYPDAQIYIDLKGASDTPVPVSEAFAHVIRSFGKAELPEDKEGREALYRSVLHGKRALLLMDNARDAAQVQPLLPPQGCAFLVTSRRHFTLPGLFVKDLNTLPSPDAEALLLAIAPRIDGHAKAISQLCGFLPQALRLAASAIAEHKDLPLADYVRRLGDEKKRLQLLKEDEDGGQSVEASIGLSYRLLDAPAQKRWRSLGIFPDTFDVAAAAAVWETEVATVSSAKIDSVQKTLGALLQYSMLEWNETSARYRLHDLMRDFARSCLDSAETQEASNRHARHYLAILQNTNALYQKGGDALRQALALFDLEWGNVQAGQAWAANHAATNKETAQLCSDYPDEGTYLLFLRQHPREQIRWRELALAAARKLKDRAAEGRHLGNLGLAYYSLGEYRRAIGYHDQHLAIARETSDRNGEGNALSNLGLAYDSLGEYRRAIEYHDQRLAIARKIGNRLGEATALGNLGVAYHHLGEYRRAIEYHDQHLAIAREIGDRKGEGHALGNLGIAYDSSGEYRRAIEYQDQRLSIAREIGDRLGEGNALWNASLSLDQLGKRQKAIEYARAALQIYEQIESPDVSKVRKQLQQWQGPTGTANP